MSNLALPTKRLLPWGNLGEDVKGIKDARTAMEKSGLDWEVEMRPIFLKDRRTITTLHQKAICRKDLFNQDGGEDMENPVLGLVSPSYKPVQNTVVFDWINPLLKKKEAELIRAGCLGNGKRVWIAAKANRKLVVAKDEMEVFLLFYTSHDGTLAVNTRVLPVRSVCTNILSTAHSITAGSQRKGRGDFQISVKHIGAAEIKVRAALQLMKRLDATLQTTSDIYEAMFSKKVKSEGVKAYMESIFPDKPKSNNNKQRVKLREDLVELHDCSPTLKEIRGTAWGLYNTITEYVSHGRSRFEKRSKETRFRTLCLGGGQRTIRTALNMAIGMLN